MMTLLEIADDDYDSYIKLTEFIYIHIESEQEDLSCSFYNFILVFIEISY